MSGAGDGGWTEIRRKYQPSRRKYSRITSFFATNIPDGAVKGELLKLFSRHGSVTDVYMGQKKGKNGKKFAFIRFGDLDDEVAMERKLNGIEYRGKTLAINIEKFQRKANTGNREKETRRGNMENDGRKPPTHSGRFDCNRATDHRSFADVLSPSSLQQQTRYVSLSIPLRKSNEHENLIGKSEVVGEAISLAHLELLPTILGENEDQNMEIKYIGGLRILISFRNSECATKFINNRDRWKEQLKWVSPGNQMDAPFQRIAWVKVLGLPLSLWSDRNFVDIVKSCGEIIVPFDGMFSRVDLSSVKLGILTSRHRKILEEAKVTWEGNECKIGIVEIDEEWFPFRFNHRDGSRDSGMGEDSVEDENDGIPDSFAPDQQQDPEVGDFVTPDGGDVDANDPLGNHSAQDTNLAGDSVARPQEGNNGPFGPFSGVDPSKWFGAFQSSDPKARFVFSTSQPISKKSTMQVRKRRRFIRTSEFASQTKIPRKEVNNTTPIDTTSHVDEEGTTGGERRQMPSFDLNCDAVGSGASPNGQSVSSATSTSEEVRRTCHIGRELGFGISMDDPILQKVMGEIGEKNGPQ